MNATDHPITGDEFESANESLDLTPKIIVVESTTDDDRLIPTVTVTCATATEENETTDEPGVLKHQLESAVEIRQEHGNAISTTDPGSSLSVSVTKPIGGARELSFVDRKVLEILESERCYVRDLSDIISGYLSPMRDPNNKNLKVGLNHVDVLFGNIEAIYEFNESFLSEVQFCKLDPVRIARCFVDKKEGFKIYSHYCTNYPEALDSLTMLTAVADISAFFHKTQCSLKHSLPLGAYLLKPVQRILKYHLLMEELVRNVDVTTPGYSSICQAFQSMSKVADHINEMKRKHEGLLHIQEIQASMTGWEGRDLTFYGDLILEDDMKMPKLRALRRVFLFERILLLTKRHEDGGLSCKVYIDCSNLTMIESIPKDLLGFNVLAYDTPKIQHTVQAKCMEQKQKWIRALKQAILDNFKAYIPISAKQAILECSTNIKPVDIPNQKFLAKKRHSSPMIYAVSNSDNDQQQQSGHEKHLMRSRLKTDGARARIQRRKEMKDKQKIGLRKPDIVIRKRKESYKSSDAQSDSDSEKECSSNPVHCRDNSAESPPGCSHDNSVGTTGQCGSNNTEHSIQCHDNSVAVPACSHDNNIGDHVTKAEVYDQVDSGGSKTTDSSLSHSKTRSWSLDPLPSRPRCVTIGGDDCGPRAFALKRELCKTDFSLCMSDTWSDDVYQILREFVVLQPRDEVTTRKSRRKTISNCEITVERGGLPSSGSDGKVQKSHRSLLGHFNRASNSGSDDDNPEHHTSRIFAWTKLRRKKKQKNRFLAQWRTDETSPVMDSGVLRRLQKEHADVNRRSASLDTRPSSESPPPEFSPFQRKCLNKLKSQDATVTLPPQQTPADSKPAFRTRWSSLIDVNLFKSLRRPKSKQKYNPDEPSRGNKEPLGADVVLTSVTELENERPGSAMGPEKKNKVKQNSTGAYNDHSVSPESDTGWLQPPAETAKISAKSVERLVEVDKICEDLKEFNDQVKLFATPGFPVDETREDSTPGSANVSKTPSSDSLQAVRLTRLKRASSTDSITSQIKAAFARLKPRSKSLKLKSPSVEKPTEESSSSKSISPKKEQRNSASGRVRALARTYSLKVKSLRKKSKSEERSISELGLGSSSLSDFIDGNNRKSRGDSCTLFHVSVPDDVSKPATRETNQTGASPSNSDKIRTSPGIYDNLNNSALLPDMVRSSSFHGRSHSQRLVCKQHARTSTIHSALKESAFFPIPEQKTSIFPEIVHHLRFQGKQLPVSHWTGERTGPVLPPPSFLSPAGHHTSLLSTTGDPVSSSSISSELTFIRTSSGRLVEERRKALIFSLKQQRPLKKHPDLNSSQITPDTGQSALDIGETVPLDEVRAALSDSSPPPLAFPSVRERSREYLDVASNTTSPSFTCTSRKSSISSVDSMESLFSDTYPETMNSRRSVNDLRRQLEELTRSHSNDESFF